MNANYASSPSASIFHSYCLAWRKSWPDKPWGWKEVLDHSQDQDDTWKRNTKGLSLLELLCQERFSLGTTGTDRCWSMQVSKRMDSLQFCRRVKGLRKKARSFAGVTLPLVWKYWENKVREEVIRIPTTHWFHGVFLSLWSIKEQLFLKFWPVLSTF